MRILTFLLKHKLLVHYITVVVVIAGVLALFSLRREARPNVNFNRVNITAVYPGASPVDVEELVIDPIEEKIGEVDGVEEYRSVSFVGAGFISVKIDQNYPDPASVVDEIRRKVSEVDDLPVEVKDPTVAELKADNIPVLNIALYGEATPFELKLETEKLKDFLKNQTGVTKVEYVGITDLQIKVLADNEQLEKHDITLFEILNQLQGWAKQKPGGLFENSLFTSNITIGEDLNDLEKIKNFIVRSNDSGRKVLLKDIAEVQFGLENTQSASLFYDKDAVLFTVVKSPNADAVTTVDNVKKELERYSKNLPPNLNLKLYQDQSKRIRDKLNIVTNNAITGLILVLIILLIFLDWRSALITSMGIPIAVLGGIVVIHFLGFTLNSLVVVGMIIVLGMLVDDAIVVCENIYSKIEEGDNPFHASVNGTMEVAPAVISSVLTTVFAFLPIAFMGDIIGQFLSVIPITVIALLSVSLLEALIVLPIHSEELMKPKKQNATGKKGFIKKIEGLYKNYLEWSIKSRWIVLAVLAVFILISGFQGKKVFERFSLFPAEGLDGLSVRLELPKNTPIELTKKMAKKLSLELESVSEKTFDTIYSTLGQVTTGGSSGSRQNGSHLAMINVKFISDSSFNEMEKRIVGSINKVVNRFSSENNISTSVTLDRPGPPIGKPIQIQTTSRDFELGLEVTNKIKDELNKIKGVKSLETDLDGDALRYRLKVNNELAVSEGVDPSKISRSIFSASTGIVSSEILQNNEKVEILLGIKNTGYNEQLSDNNKKSIDHILNLKIRNTSGQAVPIKNFVKVIEETGPSSIQRYDGIRTITLFGEVDNNVVSGKQVNAKIAPFLVKLRKDNPNLKILIGGGEKDRLKAVKDTVKLYGIAIILIFMVISLTFNSTVYPFLVLTSIPMGLSGVIWALVLHGKSLTIMGVIGIVGLSGVVVNISIIFLKFVQDRVRGGEHFHEAIIDAGVSRLRPILMTTTSTLIGLLPSIYGIGGIDTFVQPIAMVLGWGLFVATILTVLTLPAITSFFSFLDKN